MKYNVMHSFDKWKEDKVKSEHDTYEEAKETADKLNKNVSSYEFYYVNPIKTKNQ